MNNPKASEFLYFAGIRVFLNPFLFIEMKEVTNRNAPTTLIIHTTLATYTDIELQYVAAYSATPKPFILFGPNISWRQNVLGGHHNFYKAPKHTQARVTTVKAFEIPYYDVERIEHEDGSILWQKKR